MKKLYNAPECELIVIKDEDVITASYNGFSISIDDNQNLKNEQITLPEIE